MSADSETWTTNQSEPKDYAIFGIVLYLIIGLGTFIYNLLVNAVVDEDTEEPEGLFVTWGEVDVLLDSATSAFHMVDAGSGFLIAMAIGAFYYFVVSLDEDATKPAAIAAAAGSAVSMLLFFVIALVANGNTVSASPDIIGIVISVVIAAGVAAAVPLALDAASDQVD